MRIAIPLKSHNPAWGGPGTYTIEIVRALLRLDHDNEYVLMAPRPVEPSTLPEIPGGRTDTLLVVTDCRAGVIWDQLVLPRLARRYCIDLLFSPTQTLPVSGNFAKVMTVHGAEPFVLPHILDWRNRLKWQLMKAFYLPHADGVLCVSQTMARDLRAATSLPENRVFITPLGVSPTFRVMPDKVRLAEVQSHYALNRDFILFVGKVFPNKNIRRLLRAFAMLKDRIPHQLVIVGGLRWKFAGDLAALKELRLRDRVLILGFVAQDDLVALYNQATCFVLPSLYESFGLAMLEAMACGCPVVCSKTGALPEVAGNAVLYCDPFNPKSIADSILRLTTDPELRRAMAVKGLTRAASFTWERCARETRAILEIAAQGKR